MNAGCGMLSCSVTVSHRSAVGAVFINMSWCYANCVPVQIDHGLHSTVHELIHPETLFFGSQSPPECDIKVAHAQYEERALLHKHPNDQLCWEIEQYRWCQVCGITGTENPEAVLPYLYGSGTLNDERQFLVVEKVHGVTAGEIQPAEVEQVGKSLAVAVDTLIDRACLLHGDVHWNNELHCPKRKRVRQSVAEQGGAPSLL